MLWFAQNRKRTSLWIEFFPRTRYEKQYKAHEHVHRRMHADRAWMGLHYIRINMCTNVCRRAYGYHFIFEAKNKGHQRRAREYLCMTMRVYVCMYVCTYVLHIIMSIYVNTFMFLRMNVSYTHYGITYVWVRDASCICLQCTVCMYIDVHMHACMYV